MYSTWITGKTVGVTGKKMMIFRKKTLKTSKDYESLLV